MKALCPCSVRAFELFVKNVTDISLQRRFKLQSIQSFSHPRSFRTGPPLKLLERNVSTRTQDESLIPFEVDGVNDGSSSANARNGRVMQSGQEKTESKRHLDDDWHAEIEIESPGPQETRNTQVETSTIEEVSLQREEKVQEEHDSIAVDNVSFQELHKSDTPSEEEHHAQLLPDSPPNRVKAAPPERSRLENRQQRKLRRMQAGTYRQQSEARAREKLANDNVTSILGIIKAVKGSQSAGPSVGVSRVEKQNAEEERASHQPRRKKGFNEAENASERVQSNETATRIPAKKNDETESPAWGIQKKALKEKFGDAGWSPRKRLSPDTLDGIRALHASDPASYSTEVLAQHFKITPEAIRRILKSKWRPSEDETADRKNRWERRGERKWQAMAEQGMKPPAKWRAKGIRNPHTERKKQSRRGDYVRWEDDRVSASSVSLAHRIL